MALTISDIQDLTRILTLHPEWQAEMRRLVLTEELLTLPDLVRGLAQAQARTEQRMEELAQAQARTEQRVGRLEVALAELTEAQTRTEQRVGRLEVALAELTEAQKRTEQRLEELVQAQMRTEEAIHLLANRQNEMLGDLLELRYSQRATGYFGRILRRIRVALPGALDPRLEDTLEERLAPEELYDLLHTDVVVSGRLRQPKTPEEAQAEVWLAVEVAAVIDRDDVERAGRRADLLRKAGFRAIPVVAGEGVTQEATALLQGKPIVLVLDGRSEGWEKALTMA